MKITPNKQVEPTFTIEVTLTELSTLTSAIATITDDEVRRHNEDHSYPGDPAKVDTWGMWATFKDAMRKHVR